MTALLLLSLSAQAAPMAGVDFVPFGRGDLTWVDSDQLSGTLVSETDGWLQPPLTAWGGFIKSHSAVIFGLAVARVTTTTLVAGDNGDIQKSVVHTGALRSSVDYRRYFGERKVGRPSAWGSAGLWGVVPSARRKSDQYTTEEQTAADDTADQDRSRIGAAGARVGLGAELLWDTGLALGARYDVGAQLTRVLESDATVAGTLVSSEAALTMSFTFR